MKKFDQIIAFGENESYYDVKVSNVRFPNDNADYESLSGEVKPLTLKDLEKNNEVR